MKPLVLLVLVCGCHLDAVLRAPDNPPQKKCYFSAYVARTTTITSGDSTWAVRDTAWLGAVEIQCPKEER